MAATDFGKAGELAEERIEVFRYVVDVVVNITRFAEDDPTCDGDGNPTGDIDTTLREEIGTWLVDLRFVESVSVEPIREGEGTEER